MTECEYCCNTTTEDKKEYICRNCVQLNWLDRMDTLKDKIKYKNAKIELLRKKMVERDTEVQALRNRLYEMRDEMEKLKKSNLTTFTNNLFGW